MQWEIWLLVPSVLYEMESYLLLIHTVVKVVHIFWNSCVTTKTWTSMDSDVFYFTFLVQSRAHASTAAATPVDRTDRLSLYPLCALYTASAGSGNDPDCRIVQSLGRKCRHRIVPWTAQKGHEICCQRKHSFKGPSIHQSSLSSGTRAITSHTRKVYCNVSR